MMGWGWWLRCWRGRWFWCVCGRVKALVSQGLRYKGTGHTSKHVFVAGCVHPSGDFVGQWQARARLVGECARVCPSLGRYFWIFATRLSATKSAPCDERCYEGHVHPAFSMQVAKRQLVQIWQSNAKPTGRMLVCVSGEPLSFRFALPICPSHRFVSCSGHARYQCPHNNDRRMAPTLFRKTEWRRSQHVDQISEIPLRTPPSTGPELAIAPHSYFTCCLQLFCSVWLCSFVPCLLLEVLMALPAHHSPPRHQRQHRLRSPTIPCPRTLGPFRPFSRHPTQPRPPRPPRNA